MSTLGAVFSPGGRTITVAQIALVGPLLIRKIQNADAGALETVLETLGTAAFVGWLLVALRPLIFPGGKSTRNVQLAFITIFLLGKAAQQDEFSLDSYARNVLPAFFWSIPVGHGYAFYVGAKNVASMVGGGLASVFFGAERRLASELDDIDT